MPELHEVIEVLARSASHSPSWTEADANLVAEFIDDEKPPEKPSGSASTNVSTSKGGKS